MKGPSGVESISTSDKAVGLACEGFFSSWARVPRGCYARKRCSAAQDKQERRPGRGARRSRGVEDLEVLQDQRTEQLEQRQQSRDDLGIEVRGDELSASGGVRCGPGQLVTSCSYG